MDTTTPEASNTDLQNVRYERALESAVVTAIRSAGFIVSALFFLLTVAIETFTSQLIILGAFVLMAIWVFFPLKEASLEVKRVLGGDTTRVRFGGLVAQHFLISFFGGFALSWMIWTSLT